MSFASKLILFSPGFSRVLRWLGKMNRFNGFPRVARETVKNGFGKKPCQYTRLKPGENEMTLEAKPKQFPAREGSRALHGGPYHFCWCPGDFMTGSVQLSLTSWRQARYSNYRCQ
jgi:hypothetical protein